MQDSSCSSLFTGSLLRNTSQSLLFKVLMLWNKQRVSFQEIREELKEWDSCKTMKIKALTQNQKKKSKASTRVWTVAWVATHQYSNKGLEDSRPFRWLGMRKSFGQVYWVCTKACHRTVMISNGTFHGTSYTEWVSSYQWSTLKTGNTYRWLSSSPLLLEICWSPSTSGLSCTSTTCSLSLWTRVLCSWLACFFYASLHSWLTQPGVYMLDTSFWSRWSSLLEPIWFWLGMQSCGKSSGGWNRKRRSTRLSSKEARPRSRGRRPKRLSRQKQPNFTQSTNCPLVLKNLNLNMIGQRLLLSMIWSSSSTLDQLVQLTANLRIHQAQPTRPSHKLQNSRSQKPHLNLPDKRYSTITCRTGASSLMIRWTRTTWSSLLTQKQKESLLTHPNRNSLSQWMQPMVWQSRQRSNRRFLSRIQSLIAPQAMTLRMS